MIHIHSFLNFVLGVSVLCPLAVAATTTGTSVPSFVAQSKYTKAHSLGEYYQFDPNEGWQSINVTDLHYKYRRGQPFDSINFTNTQQTGKRDNEPTRKRIKANFGLSETIGGIISGVFKGLKAIGNPQTVTITWYTGHDLKNPSCWAQGKWAPTDKSFACATTLHGWKNRPRCFKFIELCNGPKKCVFVRVVDSCAGCAPGSRHIDLTRAAFRELAEFDQGILSVQLREATEPDEWFEDLWGPKHTGH